MRRNYDYLLIYKFNRIAIVKILQIELSKLNGKKSVINVENLNYSKYK